MWERTFEVVLAVHAIGHSGGPWFFRRSWLAGSARRGRVVASTVWAAAGVAFLVAATALVLDAEWWRWPAVAGALASIPPAVVYFGPPAAVNKVGALAVDVATLWLAITGALE